MEASQQSLKISSELLKTYCSARALIGIPPL